MVVAWSSHHHRSDPCSWVSHRSHAGEIYTHSTPFTWSSAPHGSPSSSATSSSSSSSHPCGLPTFISPPSPPPTLFLPPRLATFPLPGHPSPPRYCSHVLPQESSSHPPLSGGNRISEEVVNPFNTSTDEPPGPQVPHSSASPFCQASSYPTGVAVPARAAPPPPNFVPSPSGNAPPRGSPAHFTHSPTKVGQPSYVTEGPAPSARIEGTAPPASTEREELGAFWQLLDDDLKPTMPHPTCPQSQQIFQEHKGLAHQLLVVQEEIVYLDKEKTRLLVKLDEQDREQQACHQRYTDKIIQLKNKNESLRHDHSRLSQQLEEIRSRRQKEQQTPAPPDPHHQLHHQPPPQISPTTPPSYFPSQHMQGGQPPLQQHSTEQHVPPPQYYYGPHHHHHLYPYTHNP